MSRQHEVEKNDIAREIIFYLENHPDSGDTLEGIVQWWLLEYKILKQTTAVQGALRHLAKQGLIVVEEKVKGRKIYRINERHKKAEMLKQSGLKSCAD